MYKIFYNPKTLEIKGYSDGEISMELPFVESDTMPFPFWNFAIEIRNEVPTLVILKESFTKEDWDNFYK